MAFLSGWKYRRKITIDNTNIDSDLTHFPVPVVLGASVGQSSQDVTDIFDELGGDYLKVAVTKADGETQIYAEVEQWDETNEKALLWVSKDDLTLTASSVTELYIYYDSSQSDNTSYIGTSGNRTEVWGLIGAYLYNGNLIDSAGNTDGSVYGGSPSYTDGYHGQALDIESGDSIKVSSNAKFDNLIDATFIKWVHPTVINDQLGRSFLCAYNSSGERFHLKFDKDALYALRLYYNIGGSSGGQDSSAFASENTWYRIALRIQNGAWEVFVDGNTSPEINISLQKDMSDLGSGWEYYVGMNFGAGDQYYIGLVDTDFIIDGAASDAWITADYHAQTDNLLTFGTTEEAGVAISIPRAFLPIKVFDLTLSSYKISGTVQEGGSPVARTVRLYNRSTGALIDSTTSDAGDGSFEFTDLDGEAHYVVALDDASGDTYNAIIYDRVLPVEA